MVSFIDLPILHWVKGYKGYHKIMSDKPIFYKGTFSVTDHRSNETNKPINNNSGNKLVHNLHKLMVLRSLTAEGFFTLGTKEMCLSFIALISSPLFKVPRIMFVTFCPSKGEYFYRMQACNPQVLVISFQSCVWKLTTSSCMKCFGSIEMSSLNKNLSMTPS